MVGTCGTCDASVSSNRGPVPKWCGGPCRSCVECGEPSQPVDGLRPVGKFCSFRCRNRYDFARRPARQCPECGVGAVEKNCRYCSSCMDDRYGAFVAVDQQCGTCETMFTPTGPNHVFCSERCQGYDKRLRRGQAVRVCAECGVLYRMPGSQWCSESCVSIHVRREKWQKELKDLVSARRRFLRKHEKRRVEYAQCGCGEPVLIVRRGQQWCSTRCRSAAASVPAPPVPDRDCDGCGETFGPRMSTSRFCSKRCQRRFHKMVRAGFPVGRYSRDDIAAAHGHRCGICDELIDDLLDPNDDMAWSIDHVVPRVAGGQDTIDNVQPAHRICNSIKSGYYVPGRRFIIRNGQPVEALVGG